jgi:hypothetical protein
MTIIVAIAAIVVIILLLAWLGLQIKPEPFPGYQHRTPALETMPLPAGLPAPVERFYRTVYGDQVPVIETVVLTGRAKIRPVMNITWPARFIFVHNVGKDYRHYIEAAFFGVPVLKVDEGYLDGKSFFESPMGTYYDDANTNQGANLALWAEGAVFPSIFITDPRAHWAPIDDCAALLFVPFEDKEENFVVRFNPKTDLIDSMEAMRFKDRGEDAAKVLWITRNVEGRKIEGTKLSAVGSVMWLDDGRPWAAFTMEDLVYNVDVSEYIRQRGQ